MELFLDANAHVPMNKLVQQEYFKLINSRIGHGHPSSLNLPGRESATLVENSRQKIAELLGAKQANQIIFTYGCTQAAEWGLKILSNLNNDKLTKISSTEHSSVSDAAKKYLKLENLPVNFQGETLSDDLSSAVICIHLQNEIGIINSLNFKTNYLFSDTSQSIGKISFSLSDYPIDIAIFGAHKFGGPSSVGILYIKDPNWWIPFGTGSRYFMDRTGTPNVVDIATTAIALEDAIKTLPQRALKMQEFQVTLEEGLQNKSIKIIGHKAKYRSPNTTFIHLPNIGGKMLLELSQQGIYVGLGSACNSMFTGLSSTLQSLGYSCSPHDFLRISQFGEYGKSEANHFLKIFNSIL